MIFGDDVRFAGGARGLRSNLHEDARNCALLMSEQEMYDLLIKRGPFAPEDRHKILVTAAKLARGVATKGNVATGLMMWVAAVRESEGMYDCNVPAVANMICRNEISFREYVLAEQH